MQHHLALGPNQFERVYDLFPPDVLHTVFGGVLRYACTWTLEVIKVSSLFMPEHFTQWE